MSLIKKSITGFAGVLACLGLAAASASAQQAQFTLPMEAHWGKAVLEPGTYTVTFPTAAHPTPVVQMRGNGTTVCVLLQSRTGENGSGVTGKLMLRDFDGTYQIESIQNPLTQESFYFPVRKIRETSVTAANAKQATRVAVEIKKVGQ